MDADQRAVVPVERPNGRATPPVPQPADALNALGQAAYRAWQVLDALGLSTPTKTSVLREIVDTAVNGAER